VIEGRNSLPHALVVGASSGLGYLIAKKLSTSYQVTAVARRLDRMFPLEKVGVFPIACDVACLDEIKPVVENAVMLRGKISKMVYCAGLQSIKPLRGLKVSDIEDVITVNLTAAVVFAHLFASQRVSESDAVFCAISSIAAQRPEPGIVSYSVAKAGLEALIKGMARECGSRRAVGVAPGWLDTEMTQAFPNIYGDGFRENLQKAAPRGIATIDAVSDLVMFLLSESCSYMTGQIVTIDGGASL
jgi:3-oxoacyl-[acyl-carrier protein] reductase